MTIDNITEISNINLLNDLADLILAKENFKSNIFVLINYEDDSVYSEQKSVYYTKASTYKEATTKFAQYITNSYTIHPASSIRLPLIPKFI